MNAYAIIGACGLGAVLFTALKHAYFYAPARELKRRATRDNQLLRQLITVTRYEQATKLLLGTVAYILTIITVIVTARTARLMVAFVIIAAFIGIFAYASRRNSRLMVRLASWLAHYLEPVVRKLNPSVQSAEARLHRKNKPVLTDLYESDDLKDVIRLQKKAANNRISHQELENALHALDFGTKKVKDFMVKHEDIQFVTTKEPIGPILLSELHKSGFSCFPVQGNSKHEVVGMLHMDELAQHTSGGVVGSIMDPQVLYVPEDQTLEYVLQAFSQTGKQLFMVINEREKLVGLISVTDVIEQILGHTIDGDFENYDDPSAVLHGQEGEKLV